MRRLLAGLVVTTITLGSSHALAQCGGSHGHGTTPHDSKTTKAIEHLLSSEETRRALVDAVVGDRFTMKLLLGRIAMDPAWTKEAAEVLGATLPETPAGPAVTQLEVDPEPPVAQGYSCPMHPDVTSDRAGRCPRCGMDLVQTRSKAQP